MTNAEAFATWDEAERHARGFMLRCVGDFLEIDPADVAARTRALGRRLYVETEPGTTRYLYECEGLVLSATVQVCDVDEGRPA